MLIALNWCIGGYSSTETVIDSATRPLDGPALFGQVFYDPFAMVSLNLDDAVLDGPAGTAALLELFAQVFKTRGVQRNPRDYRHALAFASLGFQAHPHDAVRFRRRRVFLATAFGDGFATGRAHPSKFGGIYETAVCRVFS
jgi:hypothetical protein